MPENEETSERRLEVIKLLSDLIEFLLGKFILLLGLFALFLPHVSFRLDSCNLAFVVFGLDIGKTKPIDDDTQD